MGAATPLPRCPLTQPRLPARLRRPQVVAAGSHSASPHDARLFIALPAATGSRSLLPDCQLAPLHPTMGASPSSSTGDGMDPRCKHGTMGASSSSSAGDSDATHPSRKFKEEARMTGDALLVLDGLVQVFPQVNFSTLIEVSISFNGDADTAADYVIHTVLPSSTADDNNANMNDDLDIHVDSGTIPESAQFDVVIENSAEHGENSMGEQLM